MAKFELFGLIGKKLGHSFSANFFNNKFEKENINAHYQLFPLPEIECFPTLISQNPELKGLNVTVPYKEDVIQFLDSVSEEAREIGAVNVIKFEEFSSGDSRHLRGYNSDAEGFRKSLLPLLRIDVKHALVLGSGGASKAVCYVLRNLGIEISLVSRSKEKGDFSYEELTPEIIKKNLLIINTTPVGMYPAIHACPPIPYDSLTPSHICYDLIYNPEETLFLKNAKIRGAVIKNGLEMLHLQALAAWEIWTDKSC